MIDRETIMTWLKKCGNGGCSSRCPYDDLGPDKCYETLMIDSLELLKHDEQTIESLERTIDKLTKALAEKPEQKFFVDSDGKMTPLPVQKHGHWIRPPKFLSESQCSVCKETHVGDYRMFKFCPDCGARMDEEVKQDADD